MVAIGEIVKWQRFCTLNYWGFLWYSKGYYFSWKIITAFAKLKFTHCQTILYWHLIVIRPLSLKSKIKMKLLVLIFIGFRARRRVRFINIISPRGQTEVSHTIRLRYLHLDGRFMFEIRPPADHSLYTAGTLEKKLSFDNKWVRWANMLKQLLRMKVFRTAVEQSLPKFSKT